MPIPSNNNMFQSNRTLSITLLCFIPAFKFAQEQSRTGRLKVSEIKAFDIRLKKTEKTRTQHTDRLDGIAKKKPESLRKKKTKCVRKDNQVQDEPHRPPLWFNAPGQE